jgi:hypothetical protein
MKDQTVILVRRFFPAAPQRGDWEFLSPVAGGTAQHWRALENLYRVLILAEPGAGKSFETRHQARKLAEKGKKAHPDCRYRLILIAALYGILNLTIRPG